MSPCPDWYFVHFTIDSTEWAASDYSLLVDALLPVLVAVGGVQLLAARLGVRILGDQRLAVPGVEVTLACDDDTMLH